jgi:hypothetical protein
MDGDGEDKGIVFSVVKIELLAPHFLDDVWVHKSVLCINREFNSCYKRQTRKAATNSVGLFEVEHKWCCGVAKNV